MDYGKTSFRRRVETEDQMETLVLFQSVFLVSIFCTINMPLEISEYVMPADLPKLRAMVFGIACLVSLFSLAGFAALKLLHGSTKGVASALIVAIFGPVGIEFLLVGGRPWPFHSLAFKAFVAGIVFFIGLAVVELIKNNGRYALARLAAYSAVYMSAYATAVYCDDGEYAWLLLAAAAVILLPEIGIWFVRGNIRRLT